VIRAAAGRVATTAERHAMDATLRRQPFSFASSAAAAVLTGRASAATTAAIGGSVGGAAFRHNHQLLFSGSRRAFQSTAGARSSTSASGTTSPSLVASLLAFPKAQPFAFNIMIATVKTSIADLITQVTIEQKAEIDWKRNGVFVVFGTVYLGAFQYWLQVNMFRKWFPTMDRFANQSLSAKLKDTAGLIDTAKQVLFDVLVHLPFMYFPTFYAVKEFVMGESWSPVDWVKDGCTKYYNNFRKDFTAMFTLWFPADCVIFAVPIWLRLPVRHIVSLGWTSYLSFLRGSKTPAPVADTAE